MISAQTINKLQASMLEIRDDMPEAEHFFLPSVYCRLFKMPKDMFVVGKRHKHAHPMMLLEGKARIVTEFGQDEIEAGYCTVSQPGAKRVVYAIEDCSFITFHYNPDDTEDLQFIEKEHIIDEDFKVEYHQARLLV